MESIRIKNLAIEVDILAGTDITIAAKELVALSEKLGIMITSSFNGCHLVVTTTTLPERLVDEYYKWLDTQ